MGTFAIKADRRAPGRSKHDLSPRDAALLYRQAKADGRIDDALNVATLTKLEVQAAIGQDWEKKTHKFTVSTDGDNISLNTTALWNLATSPVSANELATLITVYFKGATRALNYIHGRMRNPQLDQSIGIPEDFVEKRLGILWRERLTATGVSYAQ